MSLLGDYSKAKAVGTKGRSCWEWRTGWLADEGDCGKVRGQRLVGICGAIEFENRTLEVSNLLRVSFTRSWRNLSGCEFEIDGSG